MGDPYLTRSRVFSALPDDNRNGLVLWLPWQYDSFDYSGNGLWAAPLSSSSNPYREIQGRMGVLPGTAGGWFSIADRAFLRPAAVTLATWFLKPTGIGDQASALITKGFTAANTLSYEIRLNAIANGDVGVAVSIGGANANTQAPAVVKPANVWYHAALTYDGARLCVYVNGVLGNSIAQSGAIQYDTNPVQFGQDIYGGATQTNVLQADSRIYNRALAASEIAALYYQGVAQYAGEPELPALPSPLPVEVSKLNAYGALTGLNANVSKLNTYAVLYPSGADQLSTQYAEAITSGSAPAVQLSTQYAETVSTGSNPLVRLSTQYMEVVSTPSPPPTLQTTTSMILA